MITASNVTHAKLDSAPESQVCPMLINFETQQNIGTWKAVNDGVMGGRSSGGPSMDKNFMVFDGIINTNGGGFSSVRRKIDVGALSEASGVALKLRSDGRAYKITLRSDAYYRGRNISFQGNIPATPEGEWAEVTLPFDSLKASLFGRAIYGAKFNPSQVHEIGIIIADGIDGPFRLDVAKLQAC